MHKYLKINNPSKIASLVLAMTLILVPVAARARPSVEEIKLLTPQEIYYASPFDLTIGDVEKDMSTKLAPQDIASIFPDIKLGLGGVVKVWRAPSYSVHDGNKTSTILSWGLSIREVLNDGSIEIGEQDKVDPGMDIKVSDNTEISITRVKETQQKETEIIPYKTIEKDDATLERGITKIVGQGENGKREKTYLVRRENGEEVSRSLISNTVVKEPQNKIVLNGTKIIVLSSETGEASWTWGTTASRRYNKGTLIRITNLSNGKNVETRVGGWGPMPFTGRILDLNSASWETISGSGLGSGTMNVRVEEIKE